MQESIQNRYDFVFFFDVTNGNPNGDPDAGNMPRIDPETGHGFVTDVCIKRKIRNYVQISRGSEPRYDIYIKEKAMLQDVRKFALEQTVQESSKEKSSIETNKMIMCSKFFDIRTFGAVMSTKEFNSGQVRGPVQLGFARSIDPIIPMEISITRMAVETQKEAENQSGDNRTMGKKHIVPYALYKISGQVSPNLAAKTRFCEDDLKLLWEAFANMFDHDKSAARGEMAPRRLVIFRHESALGNAPAHKLVEAVTACRKNPSVAARCFSDYEIAVDKSVLSDNVKLDEASF